MSCVDVSVADGFQPTLTRIVAILERLGIGFHLTGGVASVTYGDPRLTQDIDLVLDRDRVLAVQGELLEALNDENFLFSEATARRAIDSGQMFQLLDVDTVIKLDLYVRCLIPGELDRSVQTELFPGVTLPVVSRVDAALSKLIWIHHGNHRSRRDLRGIASEASAAELAAIRRGATALDLVELLDEVLAESDEIDV